MAAEDSSGPRPPVVLRIKLRYENLDAMVHRFAPNVGKSGLFLPTKSVQPLGAEIKFELRLADDTPVLIGLGRVKAVREPDPTNPNPLGIGDPIDKALLVLHLDAAGHTHPEKILGRFE